MPSTDAATRLRDLSGLNWRLVVLALILAGIHLYLGVAAPFVSDANTAQFLVIAAAFVAGLIVYVSPYWQPVLYLLGMALALFLGTLWLLGGARYLTVGLTTGVLSLAFLALNVYLLYREF